MQLATFLDFDANRPALVVSNKRALLHALGQIAAQRLQLDVAEVVASLLEREKVGTTGFGNGVAIPHGKVDGLRRIYGLVAHLPEPVDYKAIDGTPVDLVFLLLSPPDAGADHLKALGCDQPCGPPCADARQSCAGRIRKRRADRGVAGGR